MPRKMTSFGLILLVLGAINLAGCPLLIPVSGTTLVIGTTLSCMNTAIRVTCGMAEDRELPSSLGFIHTKYITPHVSLAIRGSWATRNPR